MGDPWLSIIGLNEDSLAGLSPASRAALDAAEFVFGAPRHLELAGITGRGAAWPVPFSIEPVLARRGSPVAVLASGDPFWFGAGSSLVAHLQVGEWQAFSAPSTFSLAAAALGWRMEDLTCHGLHAAPFSQLRTTIAPQGRALCLVRDGAAPAVLAAWLEAQGCGATNMWVMERLGGPNQRIRQTQANGFDFTDVEAPVAVGLSFPEAVGLPRASGLPDDCFAHDGQITKRPVRSLTLSALQPRPGAILWDIGAGSGSVSVEWCLAGGQAVAFEKNTLRVKNINTNIADFGLAHRMCVIEGDAHKMMIEHTLPDAIFIGGGADIALLETLFNLVKPGTRLVANAVTLETEALLAEQHRLHGGELMRIDLAKAEPLGSMRGWTAARPIIQWSVTL